MSMSLNWEVIEPWKQKKQPSSYAMDKQVRHSTKGGKGKVAKALAKKR
jgi:hypothetical protein